MIKGEPKRPKTRTKIYLLYMFLQFGVLTFSLCGLLGKYQSVSMPSVGPNESHFGCDMCQIYSKRVD